MLRLSFQAATTQILQWNWSRRKFKDKIMIFILCNVRIAEQKASHIRLCLDLEETPL